MATEFKNGSLDSKEKCTCDICLHKCYICGEKARIVYEAISQSGMTFKKYVCNDCEFGDQT